jgi:hypothetical protein
MGIQINQALQPVKDAIGSLEAKAESWYQNVQQNPKLLFDAGLSIGQKLLEPKLNELSQQLLQKFQNIDRTVSSHLKTLNTIFDAMQKYFGKTEKDQCYTPFDLQDPFITGYFYVAIDIPQALRNKISTDASRLGLYCREVTGASININIAERKGLGQTKTHIPTYSDFDRSLNLVFYDTYNAGLSFVFKTWALMVADLKTGLHLYKSISDIKGNAIVVHLAPNAEYLYIDFYQGILPNTVPTLQQSRDNISIKEVQVSFMVVNFIPGKPATL